MTSRRDLILGAGLLCMAPQAVFAQAAKLPRIGCVPGGSMKPRAHQWAAFRLGLHELGYVEGRNIALEFRVPQVEGSAGEKIIAELVAAKVDVIVISTAFHAHTAKKITQTIPIVLTGTTDPVAQGLVESMARPGGNVTGMSLMSVELSGKRVEVLKQLLPRSKRFAVLWNPNDKSSAIQLNAAREAGRNAGVEIIPVEARSSAELAPAIDAATKRRAQGLIIATSGLFYGLREHIMQLSRRAKLPDLWPWGSFGDFGALLVYGPSDTENYRRAAAFVDRILKGAKPQDLPIEQATSVEFVINLKAAKTLGLKIPSSFLMRATRVID